MALDWSGAYMFGKNLNFPQFYSKNGQKQDIKTCKKRIFSKRVFFWFEVGCQKEQKRRELGQLSM